MARNVFPDILTKGLGLVGGLLVGKGRTPAAIAQNYGAPTSGSSGTFAGVANPASLLLDTQNGIVYYNGGTKASPTWISMGAGTLPQVAEVTLTNAQVLALRATPATLVAAPGAGLRLQFLGASLNISAASGAWGETTDNLGVMQGTGQVSDTIEATGFIDQTAKTHTAARPAVDGIGADAQMVNTALKLKNLGDGEYTGGNAASTIKVSVLYRTVAAL